jgi:glycosyltransferase involved in cell wall biosynthesis
VKVLFVHQPPSLASARIRVLGLLPHLGALGVECSAVPFPRGVTELRSLLSGHHGADVIVLQKKLPSALAGWAWRGARVPVVFDYDDAVFLRQQPRGRSHDSATRRRRFERALRLADAFTCGNDYLASFCRPRGKPVLVAPSPVPLDVPRAAAGRFGDPVRIGWLGGAVNLRELEAAGPALRDLARLRRVVLVVISDGTLELPGVPVEHVPWTLETQERELARLDVGIMPLADSPWARGKCAYKLLQYMAAGLPVVASPVGMNVRVVDHGRNGLLAADRAEWLAALERLLRDADLAAKLGLAGRETVEAEYAYPRQAGRWSEFLAGLSGAAGRG